MHIILVSIHTGPSPQAIPLANAYLKSYLTKASANSAQTETTIMDFYLGQDSSDCAAKLLALAPTAIGFSMYTWNRSLSQEIALGLRQRMPGLILFAGGPEATADPQGVLDEAPFDYLIVGEGEVPFANACSRLACGKAVGDIHGVATRNKDGLVTTPAPPIEDLDEIPSPWLNGTLDAERYRGILWQLSRGCCFSCDYCFDSRGIGGVRRFSLKRIEAELRHFVAKEVEQIFVLDSTFNQDAERAKKILRLIKRTAQQIHFHFEVRSEFIDSEMAQLFSEIACSLQIGLQSSNPLVLKGIGRIFKRNDFMAKVDLLNRSGAVFGFDLMYGLPEDTLLGFCDSLDFALGLYPNHLDIFPLAVLPGTALAKRSQSIGLKHLNAPPYTLLSSPSFSPMDLAEAGQLAKACDIFYTRGKAVAWFNSVIEALGTKPSAFLNHFGVWLSSKRIDVTCEADLDDSEIWQLQRSFLSEMFSTKKLKRLLALVLDLVDYHYHYAAALFATPPDYHQQPDPDRLLEYPAQLSTSTRLVTFSYEILDILEAGEPNIRKFCNDYPKASSWAAIYPGPEGICTESLIEPYYRLLEQLDGLTPVGRIAERLDIPADESLPFLEFAFAEGIAV